MEKFELLANKANYGSRRELSKILWIVIHFTANDGDSARANAHYFKNNVVKASAHYFVDDNAVYQTVPDNYTAYAVGGNKYDDCSRTGGGRLFKQATNANSISIELCDTVKNGKVYPTDATIRTALELTRELMEKYHIPVDHVIRHFDVNGKHCPVYWMDGEKWKKEFWNKLIEKKETLAAGQWYKTLCTIPVTAGYYGEIGKYKYLSANMKKACVDRGGLANVKKGNIICPIEVKTFEDGSAWFRLEGDLCCLVKNTDGRMLVEQA